jgi:hypothetical protein
MRASICAMLAFVVGGLAAPLLSGCAKNAEATGEPPAPAAVEDAAAPLPAPVVAEGCSPRAWCRVTLPKPLSINGIWGSGADNVWLAANAAVALHWDGTRLDAQTLDTGQSLFGVWGSGKSDVWMFTTSTAVWHLDQNTNSWSRSAAKTGNVAGGYPTPIRAMWGTSDSDVWAVGTAGKLLAAESPPVFHSDGWRDGDPNWKVVGTGVWEGALEYITFNAICGGTKSGVWIVGNGGKTRYSSGWASGTATWRSLNTQTQLDLFGVWCGPGGEVWAVGKKGAILRFTPADDGSFTVEPFAAPTAKPLRAVWGATPTDIWAVGDAGTILHWDGTSWTIAEAPLGGATKEDLFTIWGQGAEEIWIGGRNILLHNGISVLPGAAL